MTTLWLLLPFISFLRFIRAEEIDFPFSNSKVNFYYRFHPGDTLEIQWDGWSSSQIEETIGSEYADLYVASWDFDLYEYAQKLSDSVDVSVSGAFTWKIDIDPNALSAIQNYGLFFVHSGDAYSGNQSETLRSKGIFIDDQGTEPSSPPSSPAASGSTEPTSTPTNTATSDTSSEKEPLSRKESAGIGVGVGIACSAIAFGLAYLFLRRRRKNPVPDTVETPEYSAAYHPASTHPEVFEVPGDSQTHHSDIPPYYQASKLGPHEMPAVSPPAELSSEPHLR